MILQSHEKLQRDNTTLMCALRSVKDPGRQSSARPSHLGSEAKEKIRNANPVFI